MTGFENSWYIKRDGSIKFSALNYMIIKLMSQSHCLSQDKLAYTMESGTGLIPKRGH